MELGAFLQFFSLQHFAFGERLFHIFDMGLDGQIDFEEYVVSLWDWCTLDQAAFPTMAFRLIDRGPQDKLGADEISRLMESLYERRRSNDSRVEEVLKVFAAAADGPKSPRRTITFNELQERRSLAPALLFPVHFAQGALRTAALGTRFWERLSERRKFGGLETQFQLVNRKLEDKKEAKHRAVKARRRSIEAESRSRAAEPL